MIAVEPWPELVDAYDRAATGIQPKIVPGTAAFDAASQFLRPSGVGRAFSRGLDLTAHVEMMCPFKVAGCTHIAIARGNGKSSMESNRVDIVGVADEAAFWDDRSALLSCLRESPPRVPAYFGYEALGLELFKLIIELPDYYLTRVEYWLLQRHAEEIADLIGCGRIVELGSGSAKKTRLLLAAVSSAVPPSIFPLMSAGKCRWSVRAS